MKNKNIQAYTDESYPPFPTRSTLFWRRFIPWQFFRFIVLNLKIIRIVVGGHS
ncbi:MAG: hypothetical protein CVT94_04640 [Bacteroidetes bacterium HGW-Bacteroidetes-11]|nr:MAG: hypothetical protein CVT94_04640 [Bacteroidetes bacterium HGW-Bacteroidetes-11]